MPTPHSPRSGSMQVWPRVRAKRQYARVRSWPAAKEQSLSGFPGYKVGMTHVMAMDNAKFSRFKGEEIMLPVTIVECPPIRIAGVRLYKKDIYGNMKASSDVMLANNKELARKLILSKTTKTIDETAKFDDITIIIYTQPKLIDLKKIPEVFEIHISGKKEDKINFIKNNLDKDIKVDQVFKEGQFLDSHAVTKGKGYQGPIKRYGIDIRRHKAEKTKRGPGSIGIWSRRWAMFRVPHAGQMGYHQRTDLNKQVLKISSNPTEVNPEGGFIHYGNVKSQFLLIKGSLSGANKRLVIFTRAQRKTEEPKEFPQINYISTSSKQGR